MRRGHILARVAIVAHAAAALMCDLNPQPLPPLAAASGDREAVDGSVLGVDDDAATRTSNEAGPSPMGPGADYDAGDASDSGDASADGPG
jgi:hypothetical protein